MARIYEPTSEMEKEWKAWVKSRPAVVRKALRGLNPWTLYRMTDTDQRVTLVSASEDGTVKVFVSSEYNFTMFERDVFGVDPKLLVECELPRPGEIRGAMMSPDQVEDNIDELRVVVRPDLFVMGDDGKAVRKA